MPDNPSGNVPDTLSGTDVLPRTRPETKTPSFYKVVILNDDFTPRDFVVHVLQKFFRKDETTATHLMMEVHNKGAGVAGVYPLEIAETKSYQVNEYSRQHQYPLKCVVEKS
jgi:ATP-dependent Clp protease adaptor protein ClpS